jgi:ABC-type nitrate/sulfonate/bicarbonate transport system permease component
VLVLVSLLGLLLYQLALRLERRLLRSYTPG